MSKKQWTVTPPSFEICDGAASLNWKVENIPLIAKALTQSLRTLFSQDTTSVQKIAGMVVIAEQLLALTSTPEESFGTYQLADTVKITLEEFDDMWRKSYYSFWSKTYTGKAKSSFKIPTAFIQWMKQHPDSSD